eukprot:COSAG01_NODE_3049_length_6666_cov_2.071418_7_plen_170_part_01
MVDCALLAACLPRLLDCLLPRMPPSAIMPQPQPARRKPQADKQQQGRRSRAVVVPAVARWHGHQEPAYGCTKALPGRLAVGGTSDAVGNISTWAGATMSAPVRRNVGQKTTIATAIRQNLNSYSDGQILDELLQNADDAHADRAAFMLDLRHHATRQLYGHEGGAAVEGR